MSTIKIKRNKLQALGLSPGVVTGFDDKSFREALLSIQRGEPNDEVKAALKKAQERVEITREDIEAMLSYLPPVFVEERDRANNGEAEL